MNATHLLVLKECTINADDAFPYDASFIFYNFPSLHALDLSSNYLFALPSFIHFSALNDTPSQLELNFLDLKSNSIKQLRHSKSSAMCKAFPKLLYLDISRNYMKTIEKLCLSLTGLYAQNNDLYENATINFQSIRELRNLMTLYLDDNALTNIPRNLFEHMNNLRQVSLIGNQLSFLEANLFLHNSLFLTLDLTSNFIQQFDVTVLRNVSGLKQLYLRKNQISIFDESFVNYVNKTPSLVTLRIDNNSFDCSCGQLYFQTWVKHSNLIEHKDDLRCHQPHSLQNQTVAGYKQPLFDCYIKWVLVGFAAFVGLLLVVMVTYRLRWYLALCCSISSRETGRD